MLFIPETSTAKAETIFSDSGYAGSRTLIRIERFSTASKGAICAVSEVPQRMRSADFLTAMAYLHSDRSYPCHL